jgi:hypothetical protein
LVDSGNIKASKAVLMKYQQEYSNNLKHHEELKQMITSYKPRKSFESNSDFKKPKIEEVFDSKTIKEHTLKIEDDRTMCKVLNSNIKTKF